MCCALRDLRAGAILLSGIALVAQSEPAQVPTLVEVGHTTAHGGNCQRIVLTADGAHMLTVGEDGFPRWVALDRGRLLAASDTELLLLDAHSLATLGTLALPADFGRVETLAVSRDHRHVAVAHGPDVRILRVE